MKQDESIAICRHEIATNLKQIVNKAGELIKSGGRFYIIIPSNRLCECVIDLNDCGFEVKHMEVCYSNNKATVCLLECVKGGKSGVTINVLKEGV